MATPKERNDEREREHAARKAQERLRRSEPPQIGAQEQGDGQPENARELEEHADRPPPPKKP